VSDDTVTVTLRLLDKEYRVACSLEERKTLLSSAELVNEKMQEIRNTGKVLGADRIAVMAAINLAHELLAHRATQEAQGAQSISRRIRNLQQRIEAVLEESEGA
jgi:cell division protein ZapA